MELYGTSMAIWKQALLSLVVIAGIGVAWFFWFPGAQDVAARFGLVAAAPSGEGGSAASGGGAPAGGGARGPGGFGGGGARATNVVAQAAETAVINTKLSALGDATALRSVTIVPDASGRLDEILIENGAMVEAGEIIARLDSDAEKIALDRVRLALADAQSTYDRYRQLSTITGSQVQAAQLALDNARLAYDSARLDADNRDIRAPISGHVGIIAVDAGNTVTSSTVIGTIEDRSALIVSFYVPERLIGAVRIGDPVNAVPVARPQQTVSGVVSAIDNRVDTASGTFEVQARVPNEDDSLRPGMSFTIAMDFPGDTFVAVNPLAIQWGSDGAYVWKVVDGKAQRAGIRIVQRNTESVLIAGEVAEGDAVITEGLDGLREGAAIAIAGASATASADPSAPSAGNGAAASN